MDFIIAQQGWGFTSSLTKMCHVWWQISFINIYRKRTCKTGILTISIKSWIWWPRTRISSTLFSLSHLQASKYECVFTVQRQSCKSTLPFAMTHCGSSVKKKNRLHIICKSILCMSMYLSEMLEQLSIPSLLHCLALLKAHKTLLLNMGACVFTLQEHLPFISI
jgi:hypothetical protein